MIDRLRIIALLLVFTFVSQGQSIGQDNISLNGTWLFKTDPNSVGEQDGWFRADVSEGSWESTDVPSNWDLKNEYSHYVGKAWYRKTFDVPANFKNKVIRLFFEAVYHDSKVWLNGKLLGENNSGFLPFEFEVRSLLNYEGKNTVVVCADNSFRRGAIWNWGGIRRPVILIADGNVRIVQQHITPQVNLPKNTADVSVRVFLQNYDNVAKNVQGEVILSKANLINKALAFTASIPANSSKEVLVKTSLTKEQMHLWHFDDPFLYESKVQLKGESKVNISHFGLRKIEIDNKAYTFKLNGESIRPMGFNLVPDDRTTGNMLPMWRIKEDIDLMKSLGCNMTRLSHLPLPEELYDYLDEKGIMIYAEVPLWGADALVDKNNALPKEWLKRLVYNNYNHPSIIGWSVGNEIGHNPLVMEYVDSAIQHTKVLDSTRQAVMVSHTAQNSIDPLQLSDVGLINKYGKNLSPITDKQHQLHPEKILFYTEFGIGQLTEDLDADLDAKALMDSIRNKPYLIGASLWTFNDYRSSFYRTKEYSENRPWGIVDVFRQKKKGFYSIQKEYAPIRELKIASLTLSTTQKSTALLAITPRYVLDLPAYVIKDYRLSWKVRDASGKVKQVGFEKLPVIKPGDGEVKQLINWQQPDMAMSLQVELVSPLNYSVYDTTIFFQKPIVPKIILAKGMRMELNDFPAKSGAIRVVFEKNSSATAYKVKYGENSLTDVTLSTINHYIDIPKLNFKQTYVIALVAINSFGESEPTEIQQVPVEYNPAPPIVRYTEPANKGFFVGYATQEEDYTFQVAYTTRKGDYANARTIQTTNRGVLFVPNLQNGQAYYYRMKRFKHNFYEGSWSEEIAVTPDGNQIPATPLLQGVARQGGEAVVYFEPIKKAIGYLIDYKDQKTNAWKRIEVSAAQISQFRIFNLEKNKNYQFRIASLNEYGQSGFSEILTSN